LQGARGLRLWLLVVANIYPEGPFTLAGGFPYASGWMDRFLAYDLETPGLAWHAGCG
jgi:hypothetical protein